MIKERENAGEDFDDDFDDVIDDEFLQAAGREIMARLRREEAMRDLVSSALPPAPPPRVGRNQPCPCGSGRKSKKCCG